jgi:hypothetical protein
MVRTRRDMSKIKDKIKEAVGAVDNPSKFKTTNLLIQIYIKVIFVITASIGISTCGESACLWKIMDQMYWEKFLM